ncbi:MAG: FAD-dependent oxidoreductase [Devosia sp.]
MKSRVVILGAGFAGMELSTTLSETFGDEIDITLIDRSDHFVFGYSKLDVMFGLAEPSAVRLPYRNFVKPGVNLVRADIKTIDPSARRVETSAGPFEADYLVVSLGAEYDYAATPGLLEHGNEFYSVAGAEALRDLLPSVTGGKIVIGVCGAPYKCPPAPSECALMLHDYLLQRGHREATDITLSIPLSKPVPPSPETSAALIEAFAERNITFIAQHKTIALDGRVAKLDDGSELSYDLFLGVPKHRAPDVVEASGMAQDGWIPVNPRTLETQYPNVFAAGDIAATGTPKAGLFAEGAARAVAETITARIRNEDRTGLYNGLGTCYIEFGAGRIARVDVDFFSGPSPTGSYHQPSGTLRGEKEHFGASRRARWFGL